MSEEPPKETQYLLTQEAADAIADDMRRRGWVTTKGGLEWSKVVTILNDRRGRSATRQRVEQAMKNVGGRTALLRDILVAMGLPTNLAIELDDVDRLLLTAAHEGGIGKLTPQEQRDMAEFLREQIALRVAAGRKK